MLPNRNSCDPCYCIGQHIPPKDPVKCPTGDCFELGTVVITCENSVGPCNETGFISFSCFTFPCANPQFEVINKKDLKYLTVDSIDSQGITFTTNGEGNANDREEICFRAVCKGDDCDVKSDYGSAVIYIKDKCAGVICPEEHQCNKCTGECEPLCPNLTVKESKEKLPVKMTLKDVSNKKANLVVK